MSLPIHRKDNMIVTAAAVISLDGKLTRGNEKNIYHWVSPEDAAHFRTLIENHDVVIMGSSTYETIRKSVKPSTKPMRIIMTRSPHTYAAEQQKGKLEFTKDSPQLIMERLRQNRTKSVLVVGGKPIFEAFLRAQLIDRFFITIEPYIFGEGISFVDLPAPLKLELVEQKQLNSRGTLLLSYKLWYD